MKKYSLLCLAYLLFGAAVPLAQAQFHGNFISGDDNSQTLPSIAVRSAGVNPLIVGTTGFGPFAAITRGVVYAENNNVGTISPVHYSFGGSPIRFTAAASPRIGSNVGTVGTCRLSGQTLDDAFFTDVSSNVDDDKQQMLLISQPGTDRPNKVTELLDGSFVIVGSNTNGTVGTSWIARISGRPSYQLLFFRTIGDPAGPSSVGEGAMAVAQASDGTILVAGTTLQSSGSSQGSIYIANILLSGALKSFRTYTIGGGVEAPRVSDMAVRADGSVVLVGSTKIPGDTDNFGFLMEVSQDLQTASFVEASQPGVTTHGQRFHAIAMNGTTGVYFVAGMTQRLLNGVVNNDGLVLKVDPVLGPQVAKANDINNGADQFTDIVIRDNGNTIEAVGSTDGQPAGVTVPAGVNFFTQRTNPDLDACEERGVSLVFDTRPVTIATPVVVTNLSDPGIAGTFTLSTITMQSAMTCQVANRIGEASLSSAEGSDASSRLNHAVGENMAEVEMEGWEGPNQVQLITPDGVVLRHWSLAGKRLAIGLKDLVPGMYAVKVQQGSQVTTHQLSVQ